MAVQEVLPVEVQLFLVARHVTVFPLEMAVLRETLDLHLETMDRHLHVILDLGIPPHPVTRRHVTMARLLDRGTASLLESPVEVLPMAMGGSRPASIRHHLLRMIPEARSDVEWVDRQLEKKCIIDLCVWMYIGR